MHDERVLVVAADDLMEAVANALKADDLPAAALLLGELAKVEPDYAEVIRGVVGKGLR